MWNMREAHVPHNILHCLRGEAARALAREGEASEHQIRSEAQENVRIQMQGYYVIFAICKQIHLED
jgi:hypothetical protein